jgi:RNase P/RNase MRP subunit p30
MEAKDITLYKEKGTVFLKKIKSKEEMKDSDSCEGYLIDSSEKEVRKVVDTLKSSKEKKKKIIAVLGRDNIFNRRMIEKTKIDYLVSPERGDRKDTLKQRDSGFNHVLAKQAKANKISLVIDLTSINALKGKAKALRLGRVMQNIRICRKANCKIKVASLAENKKQLVNEKERKAFGFSLCMSSQQVNDCCKF